MARGCDQVVFDPTFSGRLRREDKTRIARLCVIAGEEIDQISVATVDLLQIVVSDSSASVKVDHERIFFLLIVVRRNEEPVEQRLTARVFESLRREDLF